MAQQAARAGCQPLGVQQCWRLGQLLDDRRAGCCPRDRGGSLAAGCCWMRSIGSGRIGPPRSLPARRRRPRGTARRGLIPLRACGREELGPR
jgi:hypothetical protein